MILRVVVETGHALSPDNINDRDILETRHAFSQKHLGLFHQATRHAFSQKHLGLFHQATRHALSQKH